MKHTISVLVENSFGVLARVSGLFSARGFNIDSLAVGETDDSTVSRMTIVASGNDRVLEQIMKQLDKLVDVIKVTDLKEDDMIDRELVLAKVKADVSTRSDIMQIVNTFRAKMLDVNANTLTIEITGGESKVDAMLELLRPYGLIEVVRTGTVAIGRNSILDINQTQKTVEAIAETSASKKSAKKEKLKSKK